MIKNLLSFSNTLYNKYNFKEIFIKYYIWGLGFGVLGSNGTRNALKASGDMVS